MGKASSRPLNRRNASMGELVNRCTRGGEMGDFDGVDGVDDVGEAGAAMEDEIEDGES
jgi:hypothetical protein